MICIVTRRNNDENVPPVAIEVAAPSSSGGGHLINKNMKNLWTEKEDEDLLKLVEKCGTKRVSYTVD